MIAISRIVAAAVLALGVAVAVDVSADKVCYATPPTKTPVCTNEVSNCRQVGNYVVCDQK